MSEMSLSMRVPSVAPRGADAVGPLKVCRGGTAVGETREEGGKFYFELPPQHPNNPVFDFFSYISLVAQNSLETRKTERNFLKKIKNGVFTLYVF